MKFNISGQEVSVKEDDLLEYGESIGEYRPMDKEIIIEKSLHRDDHLWTLLHEFFHAVYHINHFGQTSINDDVQELLIEHFVKALIDNFEVGIKKE